MSRSPSPTGANGNHDQRGRFQPGNKAAKGNPHARHVGQLRSALLEAVTAEDMGAIARKLVESAKAGNVQAVKELLDRLVGKPAQDIHVVSEEATTVRVVLLDRTASPTYKMVEELMRGELSADEPKQLEADEPKKIKPVKNEATKVKDRPIHPGARVGMDWRTASAGPVRDPK